MPKANGYSCLQVWVDTYTGWIEAFPCHSEQAKKVIKNLTHEIIPRFGLPRRLQTDSGSAFKVKVKVKSLSRAPMDCSLPGSSVHGIFQARVLEWGTIAFSIGSAFKAALTEGMSKALGIDDHLHGSWRPRSSGKVEKANDIIKRHLCKLTQEA